MYPIGTPEPNENGVYCAVVTHNTMANSYSCECEYFEKSGIACSHILKVLIKQGRPFLDNAIAKQWKIEPEEMVMHREIQEKPVTGLKRGPAKRTRKNMLK